MRSNHLLASLSQIRSPTFKSASLSRTSAPTGQDWPSSMKITRQAAMCCLRKFHHQQCSLNNHSKRTRCQSTPSLMWLESPSNVSRLWRITSFRKQCKGKSSLRKIRRTWRMAGKKMVQSKALLSVEDPHLRSRLPKWTIHRRRSTLVSLIRRKITNTLPKWA